MTGECSILKEKICRIVEESHDPEFLRVVYLFAMSAAGKGRGELKGGQHHE